jgi:hypothetical protein
MNLIGLKCNGAIHPGKLGKSTRAIIVLYVQKLNIAATSPTRSSPFSIPLLFDWIRYLPHEYLWMWVHVPIILLFCTRGTCRVQKGTGLWSIGDLSKATFKALANRPDIAKFDNNPSLCNIYITHIQNWLLRCVTIAIEMKNATAIGIQSSRTHPDEISSSQA